MQDGPQRSDCPATLGINECQSVQRFGMPRLPAATADWQFFNPRYPETAIAAWFREWDQASAQDASTA